jgi:hypothetical protein
MEYFSREDQTGLLSFDWFTKFQDDFENLKLSAAKSRVLLVRRYPPHTRSRIINAEC